WKSEVDDVAALGMIGLFARISSFTLRWGIRSGPQMAGVIPFSNSFSVHFLRVLARRIVIVSPLTRTLTDTPSFSLSWSTPSCGMRNPRLFPQRATLLVFSMVRAAMALSPIGIYVGYTLIV